MVCELRGNDEKSSWEANQYALNICPKVKLLDSFPEILKACHKISIFVLNIINKSPTLSLQFLPSMLSLTKSVFSKLQNALFYRTYAEIVFTGQLTVITNTALSPIEKKGRKYSVEGAWGLIVKTSWGIILYKRYSLQKQVWKAVLKTVTTKSSNLEKQKIPEQDCFLS